VTRQNFKLLLLLTEGKEAKKKKKESKMRGKTIE